MTEKDTFVGGSSTNSSRYNQNERARQSGDNDGDRIAPTDQKAADKTNEAYFDKQPSGSTEEKQKHENDQLREQTEGPLKNSK